MRLPKGTIQSRLVGAVTLGLVVLLFVKIGLAPRTIPRYIPVVAGSLCLICFTTAHYFLSRFLNRGKTRIYPLPLLLLLASVLLYLMAEGRFFFPIYYVPNPELSYSYLSSILLFLIVTGFSAFVFPVVVSAGCFLLSIVYVFILHWFKLQNADILFLPILLLICTFVFSVFYLLRILYFNLQQERKLAGELQNAQEKLINQEKLATLATFAAGTAHEINNPVTHMLGNIEFLERYYNRLRMAVENKDFDEQGKAELEEAVRETPMILEEYKKGFRRITEIVRNMKQIFRQKSSYLERVDLVPIIQAAIAHFKKGETKQIAFVSSFAGPLYLNCSAGDMVSVFQNIIANAVEALEDRGQIMIIGSRRDGMIEVTVEDNGIGIPPNVLNNIMEPFFSTKNATSNMGIGLTLTKTIVEQYSGSMRIQSEQGKYTKVFVTFLTNGGDNDESED